MKWSRSCISAGLAPMAASCLLPGETGDGRVALRRRQSTNNTGIPIGAGDRFDGGAKFPRGLGTQEAETDPGSLLSVKEIASAFKGLAKEYGFASFEASYRTYENATIFGGLIGDNSSSGGGVPQRGDPRARTGRVGQPGLLRRRPAVRAETRDGGRRGGLSVVGRM